MHDLNRMLGPTGRSSSVSITILDHLCQALDLTKTQRQKAEDSYNAVAGLLADSRSLSSFSPHLYVQGSFLLKTMVKPMAGTGYDVDLVCLLRDAFGITARQIFRLISEELQKRYPELILKDRCCRIDYVGEFHLDIIPACPEGTREHRILIPDRRLADLLPSCPKLYLGWFDDAAALVPTLVTNFSARDVIVANSASVVEVLPIYNGMEQEPLRRFIQILKAARNHYYQDSDTSMPSSIVLTTLAAKAYRDAVTSCAYQSMLHVFQAVVANLRKYIVVEWPLGKFHPVLLNPMDSRENFLDAWDNDEKSYRTFCEWQSDVIRFIDRMINLDGGEGGIDGAKRELSAAVGDAAATNAVRGLASARRSDVIIGRAGHLASGLIVPAVHPAARPTINQTFHGKSDT